MAKENEKFPWFGDWHDLAPHLFALADLERHEAEDSDRDVTAKEFSRMHRKLAMMLERCGAKIEQALREF